jgi:hypothetical protein
MALVGEVGAWVVGCRGRDELGVRLNLLTHIYHSAFARCRNHSHCTTCCASVSQHLAQAACCSDEAVAVCCGFLVGSKRKALALEGTLNPCCVMHYCRDPVTMMLRFNTHGVKRTWCSSCDR